LSIGAGDDDAGRVLRDDDLFDLLARDQEELVRAGDRAPAPPDLAAQGDIVRRVELEVLQVCRLEGVLAA
jgi:hypothetical protein